MTALRRIPSSEIARNGLRFNFTYPEINSSSKVQTLISVLEKKIVEARFRLNDVRSQLDKNVLENAEAMLGLAEKRLDGVLRGNTKHAISELHHGIQLIDRMMKNIERVN